MALLAGAPEKLPEISRKGGVKSKDDKPSTSVRTHVHLNTVSSVLKASGSAVSVIPIQ